MSSEPTVQAQKMTLPAPACDCHMHVFGDRDRYPLATFRSYSVGPAEFSAYRQVQQRTGLTRAVLVQASGYHTDNSCMLDTLAAHSDTCRGVAVIDRQISDAELRRMSHAGVRGIRLNLVSVGSVSAQETWEQLEHHARRLAPLGWHIQIFAQPALLAELGPRLAQLPVPVVIDHMGLPDRDAGIGQPGFTALLRLVGEGRAWAKLSGADLITRGAPDMTGAGPFVRALVAANPDKLVWGSDWPHIGWHSSAVHAADDILPYREVDEILLLRLLAEWVPDAGVRAKLLSDNPAQLYGF